MIAPMLAAIIPVPAPEPDGPDQGQLLSEAGFVPIAEMIDSKGEYQVFAPNAPVGPHQPGDLVVGFIDSGTTRRHPQLDGLVVEERNFVGGPVHDELGHGTSTMLAMISSGRIPRIRILSAKVTRDGNDLRASDVVAAFEWLVSHDARIVNVSLGFRALTADVQRLCDAIRRAPDTLVVAAAGNLGPDVTLYPAACGATNVISVGEFSGGRQAGTSGTGDIFAEPPAFLSRSRHLTERGIAAAGDDRLDDARQLFEEVLAISEDGVALTQLALIHAHEGRWSEAVPLLRRALRLAPDEPELLQTLGAALSAMGGKDEAITLFRRALDIMPDDQRALLNLTRVLIQRGASDEAGALLDRAEANQPGDVRVRRLRTELQGRNSP